MSDKIKEMPSLGLGLGLRHVHYDHILANKPDVDWFEIISENYIYSHGKPKAMLLKIAEHYPLVMHGVSLSIGSTDPIDMDYLKAIKSLSIDIDARWVSDHLCWTGVLGINSHDLLPLPLTEESLKHVIERVLIVQDYLGRPLVLENPSTYIGFNHSTIPEEEFLSEIVKGTGCGLLIDVNNTYVTCFNSGADPIHFLDNLPHDHIIQIHLAGHHNHGSYIVDTHDRPVIDEVWKLYRHLWHKTRNASTLLEWDGNIPSFDECHCELLKARLYQNGMDVLDDEKHFATPDQPSNNQSTPIDFLVPNIMDEVEY